MSAQPLTHQNEAADLEILEDINAVPEHHGEVNIKYAVLTVIDDGDPTLNGGAYALWHPFESIADDARLRFCDAVISQLKKPDRAEEEDRCRDCGSIEAGSCFFCKTD